MLLCTIYPHSHSIRNVGNIIIPNRRGHHSKLLMTRFGGVFFLYITDSFIKKSFWKHGTVVGFEKRVLSKIDMISSSMKMIFYWKIQIISRHINIIALNCIKCHIENKQYMIGSNFRYDCKKNLFKEMIYHWDQKDDKSLTTQTMGKDCCRW